MYNLNGETTILHLMEIPAEEKKKRELTDAEIKASVQKLARQNIRILKQMATADSQSLCFPEVRFDFEEMRNLFGSIGGTPENNFPWYFETYDDYKSYADTYDIYVMQDMRTLKPIGFLSLGIWDKDSDDVKATQKIFQYPKNGPFLYFDTIALEPAYQGKKIAGQLSDILVGFYARRFPDIDFICQSGGEVNTNATGVPSYIIHMKKGFRLVRSVEYPSSNFVENYEVNYAGKTFGSPSLGKTMANFIKVAIRNQAFQKER